MIYSDVLTKKLIAIYGKEVLSWAKSVIRCELEDGVVQSNTLILDPKYPSLGKLSHLLYHQFKDVDDEFTEHYTNELN